MSSTPPEAGHAAWGMVLRAAISVVLLAWLFANVDLAALRGALSPALAGATLAAAFLVWASAFPAAERWRLLAANAGIDLPLRDAAAATFMSYVALQLAPSTLGADAVRLAALREKQGRWSAKLASVMIDRAYGVMSLVLLTLASLPLLFAAQSDWVWGVLLLALAAGGAILGALAISYLKPPRAWLRRALVRAVARMALAFRAACLDRRQLAPALLLSFASHALCFAAFWLVLRAAGAVSAGANAVIGAFPSANLVALAPISINGWGVREASLVPLLGAFGIDAPTTLAASIAYGASVLGAGVLSLAAVWGMGLRPRAPRASQPPTQSPPPAH